MRHLQRCIEGGKQRALGRASTVVLLPVRAHSLLYISGFQCWAGLISTGAVSAMQLASVLYAVCDRYFKYNECVLVNSGIQIKVSPFDRF